MNGISLFAGIGGIDHAAEHCGFRTVAHSESDPFCNWILSQDFPESRELGDIRAVNWSGWQADIVWGGFPCQDLRQAHSRRSRAGLQGRKSGLWSEFERCVGAVRPQWVVIENSNRWERWAPSVRSDLSRLGYASLLFLLCPSALGAPHRRPRGWVVAHADCEGQSLRAVDAEVARLSSPSNPLRPWSTFEGVLLANEMAARQRVVQALGNAVVPIVANVVLSAVRTAERMTRALMACNQREV